MIMGKRFSIVLLLSFLLKLQAQEITVVQGISFNFNVQQTIVNKDSAFLSASEISSDYISSLLSPVYTLRFIQPGVVITSVCSAYASNSDGFDFELNQLWMKSNLNDNIAFKIGRYELNWKDGGVWNPSDVVNNILPWGSKRSSKGKDAMEILSILPINDSINIDLSIATIWSQQYDNILQFPIYMYLGTIIYPFEIKAKFAHVYNLNNAYAISIRYSSFNFGIFADSVFFSSNTIHDQLCIDDSDDYNVRYNLGVDFYHRFDSLTLLKQINISIEFLHQTDGLSKKDGRMYLSKMSTFNLLDENDLLEYQLYIKQWDGRFFSLYKYYLYFSINLNGFLLNECDLSTTAIFNLIDNSIASLNTLSYSYHDLFNVTIGYNWYYGKELSEADELPVTQEISLSLVKHI